jgi:hypothetical protein
VTTDRMVTSLPVCYTSATIQSIKWLVSFELSIHNVLDKTHSKSGVCLLFSKLWARLYANRMSLHRLSVWNNVVLNVRLMLNDSVLSFVAISLPWTNRRRHILIDQFTTLVNNFKLMIMHRDVEMRSVF